MLTINNTLDGYLKDVEIKGNTIQDASNLADIKSVGEKVEGQELYEIPVLSCAKNLIDNSKLEVDNGLNVHLKSNVPYTINFTAPSTNTGVYFKLLNIDESNYDGEIQSDVTWYPRSVNNCNYEVYGRKIQISFSKDVIIKTIKKGDITNFQLEEGTVATPYEPYQEDKITILSPTPLEKVGDVADRLICKDGVWGVEKNVDTVVLNGSENWLRYYNGQRHVNSYYVVIPNVKEVFIISNKFKYGENAWDNESEDCMSGHISGAIYVAKQDIASESDFKQWLQANPTTVKYVTTQPTFIPLPHDQQVKLRTFANKTNISFLTEIEGTIKAQVPKSIGATVNTHTEQISNLNKELDRVKKLEESTVSTVETESDFTTVEATSNGYFEDVKLEGKTLVNLFSGKVEDIYSSTNKEQLSDGYIKLKQRSYGDCIHTKTSMYKPDTVYTLVIDVKENTLPVNSNLTNSDGRILMNNGVILNPVIPARTTGIFVYKFRTISDFTQTTNNLKWGFYFHYNQSDQEVKGDITLRFVLVEGDHTQNPPSYFEGLKSVGDGADEIVVSSVNENLFDKNQTLINGYISMRDDYGLGVIVPSDGCRATDFIRVDSNTTYTLNNDNNTDETCGFYDATKKCITVVRGNTVTSPSNAKYMRCTIKRSDFEQGFQIVRGTQTTKYTPHQADKKRLLYYNNETQTWEKPVLREWDSIEKHADGKYYYHQRSGEVVLNGSENISTTGTNTNNTMVFGIDISTNNYNNQGNSIVQKNVINNKFSSQYSPDNIYSKDDIEGISITDKPRIRILKSKLSSIDVEGFKQWLQENNVTVVYQLAEEKVYECTNIDLITYANETNYIVESGAIVPKSTLKVHNNISNVVSLLQKKVSLLESNMTKYMITQNRMQLASTYSADSVTFKVDYALCSEEVESYNEDLYNLILHNILVGKDNYDYDKMFTMILDYASWNQISWEQFDILVGLMDIQHNPPIEEIPTDDEIVEEIPNEIM